MIDDGNILDLHHRYTSKKKGDVDSMRKLTCLLLALILVCASVTALATASKDVGGMTGGGTSSGSGSGSEAGYSVSVGVNTVLTSAQKQLVDDILGQITGATSPIAYFGDDVKAELEALLPGVDVDALQLNELTAITVTGYSIINGSLTINCVFPTKYTVGQNVAVVIGVQQNGVMVWKVFTATVLADGSLNVTLPADVLLSIQSGTAVIAVLND